MGDRTQFGVRIDKKREKELKNVDVTTPHGATVTVTKSRAASLVDRPPVRFGDGTARKYVLGDGEDNDVTEETQSKAKPPRRGSRTNTTETTGTEGGSGDEGTEGGEQ